MRSPARVALLGVLVVIGCHHPVKTSPAPSSALEESYCWWAVERTAMPVDSVAMRYVSAYGTLGLGAITSVRIGDTVLVHAGPSLIAEHDTAEVRMVAYQKGDSTHLRSFLAMAKGTSGGTSIGLCGRIARTAAAHAFALREPDGEERLSVWTRRR